MKSFKTPKGTELAILNLRGKEYLEVKYRLVWFREDHPLWAIETELVSVTDKSACARATVKDETGRVISMSHKFENAQGFPDFIEKAETGAIGRALALIGYGTQFCADELDEGKRIVDSPVNRTPMPSIAPDQPGPEDGIPDDSYRIPFGKWKSRTLEQVGAKDLRGYVEYLENKAANDGKQIQGQAREFIDRACEYIAAFEMSPVDNFQNQT